MTIKLRKEGNPIRGIITGYNSLVSNSENFLKTLLKPLVENCTYAIKDHLNFKVKLLEDKIHFNPSSRGPRRTEFYV